VNKKIQIKVNSKNSTTTRIKDGSVNSKKETRRQRIPPR